MRVWSCSEFHIWSSLEDVLISDRARMLSDLLHGVSRLGILLCVERKVS